MLIDTLENTEKISVIMGVLCGSDKLCLLERAVRSVLEQSYSNFEFLICDYGSDIDIMTYLDKAAASDDRIKLIREDKLTLPEKLNCCLKFASGTYVARMDDDDFSAPCRFAKQTEFLKTNTGIAFAGSNVRVVCSGEEIGEYTFPEFPTARDFLFKQPFIHPALMLRREALVEAGGYSEDKRCILCEDYDLLMRMYAKGLRGANIQEKLFDYTVSPGLPSKRKFNHRVNECVVRFRGFKANGLLPMALPYVIKPLLVWLIPQKLLGKIKKHRMDKGK